jgi:hypothetical protein
VKIDNELLPIGYSYRKPFLGGLNLLKWCFRDANKIARSGNLILFYSRPLGLKVRYSFV